MKLIISGYICAQKWKDSVARIGSTADTTMKHAAKEPVIRWLSIKACYR